MPDTEFRIAVPRGSIHHFPLPLPGGVKAGPAPVSIAVPTPPVSVALPQTRNKITREVAMISRTQIVGAGGSRIPHIPDISDIRINADTVSEGIQRASKSEWGFPILLVVIAWLFGKPIIGVIGAAIYVYGRKGEIPAPTAAT